MMISCFERVLQIAALVQIVALFEAVPVHLVKQGSQAHAEALRGLAAVAARRPQCIGDRAALRALDYFSERTAPRSLLPRRPGAGGRERVLPKIDRLQDLRLREHCRPFDRMLERPHVPGPRLLPQPSDRRVTQLEATTQSTCEQRGEVPSQWSDVLPPLGEGREMNRDDVQPIE